LTALVIAFGGVRLAREQKVEKIERDRTVLNRFADQLQDELRRLELAYTDHLRSLAVGDKRLSNIELRERAEAIWGVRQISLLRRSGRAEFHLAIDEAAASLPVPEFNEDYAPPGRQVRTLDPEVVGIGFPGTVGWISGAAETGEPAELLFWQVAEGAGGRVFVISIDENEVAARVNEWLGDWMGQTFAEVRQSGGPDLLMGGRMELAVVGEIPDFSPDHVNSMRTRFGNWKLQSWDLRQSVVSYEERVIKVALALAMVVAATGFMVFFKLRQALRLAEQRVSFVNQVSHELRTPLTNILLNTDLAVEGANPSAQRRLGLVREEAGRLRRLIDNVLTFSKLRSDGNARTGSGRCEVGAVIDQSLEQFASSLKRRAIVVEWTRGGRVFSAAADGDEVAQIIGNLISNAEKYAASGKVLMLKAFIEGGEVVVKISDSGPGIRKSERERVFDAFHRLDDRVSEGSSGTGLGLNIARSLAESNGGSLRLVDSEDGAGATFELRLPLADDAGDTVIDFPKAQAS